MPPKPSVEEMDAILFFDPQLAPKSKAEGILERLLDQYFSLPLYRHYKMALSGSVTPSLSDSLLPGKKAIVAVKDTDGRSSDPQRSHSGSEVYLASHFGVNMDHQLRDFANMADKPQPGPSGYVPKEGRFRNIKSMSSYNLSASSSSSSLYSTESEVNKFFEGYMDNIMPYHWIDDDDHSVITVSSSDSILSEASSVMSVHSNIDYNYMHNPCDEEMVGPHGDDEWTIADPEVVIDLADTQEVHHLQHPPVHPPLDQGRFQVTVPHRISSHSVLISDRKRKFSDDMTSQDVQPSKRARVSVSDTNVSCSTVSHKTPQLYRRRIHPARLRLVMDQE